MQDNTITVVTNTADDGRAKYYSGKGIWAEGLLALTIAELRAMVAAALRQQPSSARTVQLDTLGRHAAARIEMVAAAEAEAHDINQAYIDGWLLALSRAEYRNGDLLCSNFYGETTDSIRSDVENFRAMLGDAILNGNLDHVRQQAFHIRYYSLELARRAHAEAYEMNRADDNAARAYRVMRTADLQSGIHAGRSPHAVLDDWTRARRVRLMQAELAVRQAELCTMAEHFDAFGDAPHDDATGHVAEHLRLLRGE